MSAIASFPELIAPFSIERFQEEYWERKPLYLDGQARRDFESVLKVSDLSAFLGRSDIRHPSLRLVMSGSEIPLENYTRELRLYESAIASRFVISRIISRPATFDFCNSIPPNNGHGRG